MADLLQDGPWGRLATETAKQYRAFSTYYEMGPERSIRGAIEKQEGGWTTGRQRKWEYWSSRNEWVKRAEAWDDAEVLRRRKIHLAREAHVEEVVREFEIRDRLRRIERADKMEALLNRIDVAPVTKVRQEREVIEGGVPVKTRTEVEGLHVVGYATLAKTQAEIARLAITGLRDGGIGAAEGRNEEAPKVSSAEFSLFKPADWEEKDKAA